MLYFNQRITKGFLVGNTFFLFMYFLIASLPLVSSIAFQFALFPLSLIVLQGGVGFQGLKRRWEEIRIGIANLPRTKDLVPGKNLLHGPSMRGALWEVFPL